MATLTEYDGLVQGVADYFNTDAAAVWSMINQQNISPSQLIDLLPTTDKFLYGNGYNSGYTAVKYANGEIATWNNVAALQTGGASGIEGALDSNAGALTQTTVQLPATTDFSGTGGAFKASKGLAGAAQGVVHATSVVSTAVAGLGLGIRLGKAIESTLYNAMPDFWDNVGLSDLNPEHWDSLTIDMSDTGWEGVLKRGINAILGIDSSGNSQLYIDENMAAYLAMYMQGKGVFNPATQTVVDSGGISISDPTIYPLTLINSFTYYYSSSTPNRYWVITCHCNAAIFSSTTPLGTGNYLFLFIGGCTAPGALAFTEDYYYGSTHTTTNYYASNNAYTYDGKTVYPASLGSNGYFDPPNNNYSKLGSSANQNKIAWSLLYGTIQGGTTIDGISNQSGATLPNFTGCITPEDFLAALQSQFPDMFSNGISQSVAQPDGTVKIRNYVPIGTASGTGTQDTQGTTNPDTTGQSQSDTSVNPNNADNTLLQNLIDLLTNTRKSTPDGTRTDTPDNPPDTGNGDTPTVVAPTGQASALWSVYNPSQAQLNSFGAWLWSSNFIDQVLKLFNNPMQSIIGVHKIFATPATSGAGNITVGYLDSGVSANLVSNQYTDIDCGTVKVSEQFGNVFDYTDTHIRLYLPFIGIVDLDTADVMRGSVKVVYHVDVITGACLADVLVTRDNSGGVLYQFAGDAAVRYPISSGSYIGVVSGIASAIGGVASAVMTGGATLPLAAGAIAGGIESAKTNVQHSGNFSGNAGAMGAKKPYLIIERPQTMIAEGFGDYQGKGANVRRTVAQMSGYFKFSDIHAESISKAAESEIEAIRAALESGVIA